MVTKIEKNNLPEQHTVNDFECFGPVVTKDTEWGGARMCDLGCFKQETVDSNKYYHIAVIKSKINGKWYSYFEWGRTKNGRPDKPQFLFHECVSEQEAISLCEKQFADKNTKRGQWEKIGSKERLIPKPGKDLYVVRPVARRLVGLPGAENIANEDAKGDPSAVVVKNPEKKKVAKRAVDPQTEKLFRDLIGGAVKYTRSVMSGGKGGKVTLPTLAAIEEGREILDDAMARLKVVGDDLNAQVSDKDLRQLTYQLYGRIPKSKAQGIADSAWILSKDNISSWRLDLDAFETALQGEELHVEESDSDVMQGIPAKCRWLGGLTGTGSKQQWVSNDQIADYLRNWWQGATRDRNNLRGRKLVVHNLWEVERDGDRADLKSCQEQTLKAMPEKWNNERPEWQEKNRPDLTVAERKLFWGTNTGLTFHGTRSVNVPGIVRENLRFPKELTGVVITGAMFGPGSYFADDWQKSANYCGANGSYYGGGGTVAGRHSFMFAFDTVFGVPHPARESYGFTEPPAGCHCVLGKAGWTKSWGGTLCNNEWIIYRKGRCAMRYLAEVKW